MSVVESLLGTQKLPTCFHDAKAWCNNNAILETIWGFQCHRNWYFLPPSSNEIYVNSNLKMSLPFFKRNLERNIIEKLYFNKQHLVSYYCFLT